jgi:hypothetical protein
MNRRGTTERWRGASTTAAAGSGATGLGDVVEGPLAVIAPVAFAARAVVGRAPESNGVALAPRTLRRTIFPPQYMDVRLALFGVEELVPMREYRHG